MSYTLLYPKQYDVAPIQDTLETSGVLAEPIQTPAELKISDGITVFLLDAPNRPKFAIDVLRRFVHNGGAVVALGADGEHDVPDDFGSDLLAGFLPWRVHFHGTDQSSTKTSARGDCRKK